MIGVRIAALYRPEILPRLEDALAAVAGPELAMIDTVLQNAGDPKEWSYVELEHEVNRLAEQQAAAKLQQRKKPPAKK
jgi:hypothetical protein